MLLKRMDEIIAQGLFDLKEEPEVNVYIAEPFMDINSKSIVWETAAEGRISRSLLHYDDTADGSKTFNGSWRDFYASGKSFGQMPLYSGSSTFFSDRSPNFGGIAKTAIYLRYSAGFLEWLEKFDPETADRLHKEIPAFEENIAEDPKTKRLKTSWYKFNPPDDKQWALASICRLSNGKLLVLWLSENCQTKESLDRLGIDTEHSLELMGFLDSPRKPHREIVTEEFQIGSGLGRNAFGKKYKTEEFDNISQSEYHRLMGVVPGNSIQDLRRLWANKLEYRIKAAPSPGSSSLLFLPEGRCQYSELKEVIDSENQKKEIYLNAKSPKKKIHNDDQEETRMQRPSIIPTPYFATVFLTHLEGDNKKKRIIQQIFPNVSLGYLQALNAELLHSNLQGLLVDYMKYALTGQDSETPCVYRYWTEIFTKALQRRQISGREVFQNFQRFCKSQSSRQLIDHGLARKYFQVIGKLLRLQHLITVASKNPEHLESNEFSKELSRIENFKDIQTGVFGMTSMVNPPTLQSVLGEASELLREKEKNKLENFIRFAWSGVPEEDFNVFVRGALTGMLLNNLCWTVRQEGRSFSATQGRHPASLRGEELFRVFEKGVGLLMNLDKAHYFNGRVLSFLKSLEQESRRDAFNSGLICGMVYSEEKNDDTQEVNND